MRKYVGPKQWSAAVATVDPSGGLRTRHFATASFWQQPISRLIPEQINRPAGLARSAYRPIPSSSSVACKSLRLLQLRPACRDGLAGRHRTDRTAGCSPAKRLLLCPAAHSSGCLDEPVDFIANSYLRHGCITQCIPQLTSLVSTYKHSLQRAVY